MVIAYSSKPILNREKMTVLATRLLLVHVAKWQCEKLGRTTYASDVLLQSRVFLQLLVQQNKLPVASLDKLGLQGSRHLQLGLIVEPVFVLKDSNSDR